MHTRRLDRPLVRMFVAVGAIAVAAGCSKTDEPKPAADTVHEVTLDGVDTASLTPRERREWSQEVTELLAPCTDTPVSLAQCVKEKRACKTCVPAAKMLAQQVQAGRSKKEREEAFHARFDPSKVKQIAIDGSPSMGPENAAETIVEWADFECPFCRLMYPLLDEIVHKFPEQVRFVFKFYPLGAHPHGELAARAAIAALDQGKFWQMHHLLFDNQEHLEQADLERYAKQLDLDLAKFKADMNAPETTQRIETDKKQADALGLQGTPFLFFNGREVDFTVMGFQNPPEDLVDWVKLDIELAGQVPKMASSASAPPTAAPSVSAAASSSAGAPSASSSAKAPRKP